MWPSTPSRIRLANPNVDVAGRGCYVTDEQTGERHAGIHAGRDLTVEGEGHKLAGRDIIEAETYIANAVIQQTAPPTRLGLLPPDVTEFTGRESEIARLEAELLNAQGQAVVISAVAGKPGVGKSALAVHLAHRLADRFPDGVAYVSLRGADRQLITSETALTELLHVLRCTRRSTADQFRWESHPVATAVGKPAGIARGGQCPG
jgi:hypothetical protein